MPTQTLRFREFTALFPGPSVHHLVRGRFVPTAGPCHTGRQHGEQTQFHPCGFRSTMVKNWEGPGVVVCCSVKSSKHEGFFGIQTLLNTWLGATKNTPNGVIPPAVLAPCPPEPRCSARAQLRAAPTSWGSRVPSAAEAKENGSDGEGGDGSSANGVGDEMIEREGG